MIVEWSASSFHTKWMKWKALINFFKKERKQETYVLLGLLFLGRPPSPPPKKKPTYMHYA
jgi:hypothetical protein